MHIVHDIMGQAPCTSVNHCATVQFASLTTSSETCKLDGGNSLFAMLALSWALFQISFRPQQEIVANLDWKGGRRWAYIH